MENNLGIKMPTCRTCKMWGDGRGDFFGFRYCQYPATDGLALCDDDNLLTSSDFGCNQHVVIEVEEWTVKS